MKYKAFQRWCKPKSILIVAELSTHPARIQQVIQQVRAPGVRIMLVSVLRRDNLGQNPGRALPMVAPQASLRFTEASTVGLRRSLQWGAPMSGVEVLKSTTVDQIPGLAYSLNVDRVVSVALGNGPMPMRLSVPIEEELIDSLRIPLCIMGGRPETKSWCNDEIRRILLPVSFESDLKLHFRFASQLALAHQARLTVLHVFRNQERSLHSWERTPVAVQSQLPIVELMRDGLLCPMEVTVAEGDPASAILKLNAKRQHDLIVMGSPAGCSDRDGGVLQTVMFGARCPLIVLGRCIDASQGSIGSVTRAGSAKREPAMNGFAEKEAFHAMR